jgi:hypothetical protein
MDPEITKRLLALPSLREQAERDMEEAFSIPDWDGYGDGDTLLSDLNESGLGKAVAHFAGLLADLTRWQSQAWALREIGRLLWWVHGDICLVPGKNDTVYWAVEYRFPDGTLVARYSAAPSRHNHHVPGLPADRPGAIAEILLHLSGVK